MKVTIKKMLPSVQSYPLSSTISLANIDLKLKSKNTIRGHPNYSSSRYRRLTWCYNSSTSTWSHKYLCLPSNTTFLVTYTGGNIICDIIHHSPPVWPYLPTIYQALLQHHFFLCNNLVDKNFYIQEVLEGIYSIINVVILVYSEKKINYIYYGTTSKLVLFHHTGQLLQF